jgi:hypothetical protein
MDSHRWRVLAAERYFTVWERTADAPQAMIVRHSSPWSDHPWIGTGPEEGVRLTLHSRRAWNADFEAAVQPGPCRADPVRNLALQVNGRIVWTGRTEGGTVRAPVSFPAGNSEIILYCTDVAIISPLSNGDPRRLLAGVARVALVPTPGQPDTARLDLKLLR